MHAAITKLGLVLTLLLPLAAFGRIGETEAQCIARYGQPASRAATDGSKKLFIKSGFYIMIEFSQDRAELIMYSKVPVKGQNGVLRFTDEEIRGLLALNGSSVEWTSVETGSPKLKRWFSRKEDTALVGTFHLEEDPSLIIQTAASLQRWHSAQQAEEAGTLKGL